MNRKDFAHNMFEETPKILFPVELLSVQAVDDNRLHGELLLKSNFQKMKLNHMPIKVVVVI